MINHSAAFAPTSSATEGEFVEILGDANTDYSNFYLLEIEGDTVGFGLGVIEEFWQLGTTDANGYWDTFGLAGPRENGTITWMIVEGFTGTVGSDVDADNDGVIDTTFWTRIVDDVARDDGNNASTLLSDGLYSSTVISASFATGESIPGGASRIPNGTDTDTAADWVVNDFRRQRPSGLHGSDRRFRRRGQHARRCERGDKRGPDGRCGQ